MLGHASACMSCVHLGHDWTCLTGLALCMGLLGIGARITDHTFQARCVLMRLVETAACCQCGAHNSEGMIVLCVQCLS